MSTSLKQAIDAAKVRVSAAFDAVVAKGGTKPSVANLAALPSAIESIPSGGGIDIDIKVTYRTPVQNRLSEILLHFNNVEIIEDNVTTSIDNQICSTINADVFIFNKVTSISDGSFQHTSRTIEILLPSVVYVGKYVFYNSGAKIIDIRSLTESNYQLVYNCRNLKILNCSSIKSFDTTVFNNNVNLIDLICGGGFESNVNVSGWNPTNALLTTSASLVDDGEPFANNREKLLYNIREHFAKNLNPNITATLTFSAAVGAAIDADAETKAAFPASWTILY